MIDSNCDLTIRIVSYWLRVLGIDERDELIGDIGLNMAGEWIRDKNLSV